ncbi:MAG: DNA translocase FtsK 4TM domain-containing protein [Alphaproteobacteria bacterium]
MAVTATDARSRTARRRPGRGTSERAPFLPPAAAAFVRRRMAEIGGLLLVGLGVALALALLSYDAADPSWNTASTAAPSNLLSTPGAYIADFLLQTIGIAAAIPVLVLTAWGWRLIAQLGLAPLWLRLTALPICMLLTAVTFSAIAAGEAWTLRAGLGGAVGRVLLDDLTGIGSGLIRNLDPIAVAWIAAIGAALTFLPAVALRRSDWAMIARGSARGVGAGARWIGQMIGRGHNGVRRHIEPAIGRGEPKLAADPADRPEPAAQRRTAPRVQPATGGLTSDNLVMPAAEAPRPAGRVAKPTQQKLDLGDPQSFVLPDIALLNEPKVARARRVDEAGLTNNAHLLESVLRDFGVNGEIVKVRPGPVVTLYELEPAPGTKTARVVGLADDIARSMSAVSVRVAVVPGQSTIGIELPNRDRELVALRDLLSSEDYDKGNVKLPLVLGKDIGGTPIIADLAKMPHLLVAGTTGSGKSVAINAMILSLLYRLPPDQVRFIMIDPKMLELSVYDGIPHLLAPVVTDPRKAVVALKWTVREMEERYRAMSRLGVRNISSYNGALADARAKGKPLIRTVQTGFDPETGQPVYEDQELDLTPLPYIVVIADEIADLMLVAGKDIEAAIQRLAQMARAAGIHLIMATQRPSVDVITGVIKANLPTRISFQVTSKIDSRTILGEQGAEQLLGQGDMLYMAGGGRVTRVHGPFVTDQEVERVCAALKAQGDPRYEHGITEDEDIAAGIPGFDMTEGGDGGGSEDDGLYHQAIEMMRREGRVSTSLVQRHLQIGYNRAARLVERMQKEGLVSAPDRTGKREILE